MAAPSQPSISELNYRIEELGGLTISELDKTSPKRKAIQELLGPNNVRDAKHLDSAYMEGCHIFLTSDKGDLASRRGPIESLLGLKVLHFLKDWDEFLALLSKNS